MIRYYAFIDECRSKDYGSEFTHKHHIVPRFMGGINDDSNMIKLSVPDHYKAHLLLAHDCEDQFKSPAWASVAIFRKYWMVEDVEVIRQNLSKSMLGNNNPNFGKSPSDYTRQKMRIANTGIKNSYYGKSHSNEVRKKMSDRHANVSNGCNPAAKQCIDKSTNIVYECIKDMAIAVGVPRTTMNRWIKSNKNENYCYYESRR